MRNVKCIIRRHELNKEKSLVTCLYQISINNYDVFDLRDTIVVALCVKVGTVIEMVLVLQCVSHGFQNGYSCELITNGL